MQRTLVCLSKLYRALDVRIFNGLAAEVHGMIKCNKILPCAVNCQLCLELQALKMVDIGHTKFGD